MNSCFLAESFIHTMDSSLLAQSSGFAVSLLQFKQKKKKNNL
jgi:hypothetical protein